MSGIGAIRKKIEDAFAVAREQGPTASQQPARACDPSKKQSRDYTEADGHRFQRRADAFMKAAEHAPHVKLHPHRATSYYVGDIDKQPRAEDVFAEVAKRYSDVAQEE